MPTHGNPIIDRERCKGCLLCVRSCPKDTLGADSMPNSWGYFPSKVLDMSTCIACGNCFQVCPDAAITIAIDTGTKDGK